MPRVEFGWRVQTFPVMGESATKLIEETTNYLRKTHEIFDAVWMDDHFHPWLRSLPSTTPVLECWTTLTYLSALFTDLDYSAIVLCNSYRNPAYLAKCGATLSCLTGGRFILGIGAGWKEDEYLAYGYPFPSAKERIERLEEGVRIIREMWTSSPANFAGKYYCVKDAYCLPRPVKKPPIMIGGAGEKLMLGVIARQADWWNLTGVSPATFERKAKVLEKHCSKIGRDSSEIVRTWTGNIGLAESDMKAKAIAETSPFSSDGEDGGALLGSPSTVKEQIQRFVDVGVTHFNLRFLDFPSTRSTKLFARTVAPTFRKTRTG
jgi:alkanesulfonate monooxygenase SsuD/methylene tetrahydromethanopterin reductase-like flavin-dependent oxidoreductase (luciferase family)